MVVSKADALSRDPHIRPGMLHGPALARKIDTDHSGSGPR